MKHELFKRVFSSAILIPIALFVVIKGSYIFNLFLIICFLIATYEWFKMNLKNTYKYFGFIFLIFSFYTVYKLRLDEYVLLSLVVLICVLTDIGGYIFGNIFKGPKLTKFSPNKTYSGMCGSYLLSFIITIVFFNDYFFNDIQLLKMFIYIFLISTVSQVGDIVISYFKRISKIKDTGKIIPGHGGLLDRIDGMIFAFPFFYIINLIDKIL